MKNKKGIMLNHGVTAIKNGTRHYHKDRFPLNNLIISVSEVEKSIFTQFYGYSEREIAVTGYPRHDDLIDSSCQLENSKKTILFMPTFRDNQDNIGADFKNTQLFKKIVSLITNDKLLKILDAKNIEIKIYLHHNIQKNSKDIVAYETKNIKICTSDNYSIKKLLCHSNLLITDYSSVIFDFIYMSKPFISYQFDRDDFLSSRVEKPFINIEKDLPGPVVETEDELIDQIIRSHREGYKIKEKDANKAKSYYNYRDQRNSERVFNAINSLE